jgi:hypothetical protein
VLYFLPGPAAKYAVMNTTDMLLLIMLLMPFQMRDVFIKALAGHTKVNLIL